MGVNGVTEVTNNIATTYASTINAPVEDKKKDSEVKVKAEAAAVYEKSEETTDNSSKVSTREEDRKKVPGIGEGTYKRIQDSISV
jgi:hypothetical protein